MKRASSVALFAIAAMTAAAPVSAQGDMIWKGPAVSNARDADRLVVQGVMEDGRFRPAFVSIPTASGPDVQPLLPLGENLLASASVRAFGIEERVRARKADEGLSITCRAGQAPAGIMISWPDRRMPAGYRGLWVVDGQADRGIGIVPVARGGDASSHPTTMWSGGPLSVAYAPDRADTMVFTCPPESASFAVNALRLEPAIGGRKPALRRGTWVWREQDWHGDPSGFAERAAAAEWTELAIQAPAVPDAALARLAQALAERQITFRLLDGDPAMATPEGLSNALLKLMRLRRWCDRHLRSGMRPMLELDIEPYGAPGLAVDPALAWRGWAKAVIAISA
ncbi:MAG TPA: hypothetical protein VJM09_15870, partial [Sphingobium sp.]|nr:hypothetical protein [Sphingobium sp.]